MDFYDKEHGMAAKPRVACKSKAVSFTVKLQRSHKKNYSIRLCYVRIQNAAVSDGEKPDCE